MISTVFLPLTIICMVKNVAATPLTIIRMLKIYFEETAASKKLIELVSCNYSNTLALSLHFKPVVSQGMTKFRPPMYVRRCCLPPGGSTLHAPPSRLRSATLRGRS